MSLEVIPLTTALIGRVAYNSGQLAIMVVRSSHLTVLHRLRDITTCTLYELSAFVTESYI